MQLWLPWTDDIAVFWLQHHVPWLLWPALFVLVALTLAVISHRRNEPLPALAVCAGFGAIVALWVSPGIVGVLLRAIR